MDDDEAYARQVQTELDEALARQLQDEHYGGDNAAPPQQQQSHRSARAASTRDNPIVLDDDDDDPDYEEIDSDDDVVLQQPPSQHNNFVSGEFSHIFEFGSHSVDEALARQLETEDRQRQEADTVRAPMEPRRQVLMQPSFDDWSGPPGKA